MKNMTELVGVTLLQRLRVRILSDPVWIRRLLVGLWGLVYARAGVLGITGAFGAALVAGVPFHDSMAACLGAVTGYLLVEDPSSNVGFAVLAAAVLGVKLVVGQRRWCTHRWAAVCTAGFTPLATGLPPLFMTEASAVDYLILISQSVLAASAAYFVDHLYVSGQPVLSRRGRISDTSLAVCLCILAAGLVSLQVGGVSVGRTAVIFLTLCAAYGMGSAGGAAVGSAGGLAAALVSGDFELSVTLCALGGLIAGAFRPLGRMGSAVAFVLCSGFVMLGTGRQMPVSSFFEVMVGSITFFALPEKLFGRMLRAFAPEDRDDETARKIASQRLRQTADALLQIGATTRRVAQQLEEHAGAGEDLSEQLVGQICRRCPKNTLCWVQNYEESRSVLNTVIEQLRRKQAVSSEDLPNWFRQRCSQTGQLLEAAAVFYHAYESNRMNRRRAARVRGIVVDQFEGMAMFLKNVDKRIDGCRPAGAVVNAHVREAFSRWGVEPLSLGCTAVSHRIEIEAVLPADRGDRVDWKSLSRIVGEEMGRSFALPEISRRAEGIAVTLYERPRYRLKIGGSQQPQQEGRVCGDTWCSFSAGDRRKQIILSDGMGSGGQAALDSAMAVNLMSCLLKAGADHDSALRMVNSSLLVKSGEESLATMDAVSVDLYTGKVELFKAGAAPTVLRRGKKAGSIESVSAPAGILNGVCFEHSSIVLKEGDWMIMLSDGATAAGVDWITDELEHLAEEDPQELAQRLCRAAGLRRCDGRQDDITVICARLEAERL